MAIPSRQIGWSTDSNLLWTISKELERLICVTAGGCTTTTTTTLAPTTTTTTTAMPGNIDIAPSTDFDITGDFTIEFFMNMANTDGFPRVYSFGAYPAPNAISIEGGGSVIYFWANGSPALSASPGSIGVNLVGSWNHVAIVGNGTQMVMYLNGYQLATNFYGGSISSTGLPLTIGFGNEPSSYFNGYLSNFRWSQSAVYTAPFNGSVPTSPLPNTIGTILNTFQGNSLPLELTDNSPSAHTITNSGANYSVNNPFSPSYDGSLQLGTV